MQGAGAGGNCAVQWGTLAVERPVSTACGVDHVLDRGADYQATGMYM